MSSEKRHIEAKLYRSFICLALFVTSVALPFGNHANAAKSCVELFRAPETNPDALTFSFPAARDSKAFWRDPRNRQAYLSWLEARLGIEKAEDWYSVNIKTFYKNRGTGILKVYDYNVYRLLSDLKPELNLLAWKFPAVPNGFWDVPANRRAYVEWLGKELGLKSSEDWYKLRNEDFKKNGGNAVLARYDHSLYKLMKNIFPEISFLPWKFSMVPKSFWEKRSNRVWYLKWLKTSLALKAMLIGTR